LRALALISGGLDSMLAAKLVLDQGIEVIGISFESPFFGAARARAACEDLGIQPVVLDIGEEIIEIISDPKHGFGRHANPCIDCHALMVRRAGEELDGLGASFIITGEVLGQRPKSQMRFGLAAVERESGLTGLLLRPLSARLLSPTVPELEGWIDREKLLDLNGRTRKPQIELAKKLGIVRYSSPAGGCLLADQNFARSVLDLREHGQLSVPSAKLLSVGRQFRLSQRSKLTVGRNRSENKALLDLRPEGDVFVKVVEHKGPLAILSGDADQEDLELAARIVARYSDANTGEAVRVRVWSNDANASEIAARAFDPVDAKRYAI
jgi:tRNA U34 2-thiouridine synthase MnmA/TrmU